MADLQTLERALRNAHAAGDANAARRFAAEITKMRAAPTAQQPSAQPILDNPLPPQEAPQPKEPYSGSFLPLSRDEKGNVGFDSDAGILGTLKRAVMLPGQVMKGEVPIYGADGNVSDEMIARSLETASIMSPPTPGMSSGVGMFPGEKSSVRRSTPPVPSADDLYAAADDAYNTMRNSGVSYSADAVRNFASGAKASLDTEGFIGKVAPKTQSVLDELANPPDGAVADITGLQAARKAFGRIAQNFNEPEEQAAASRVIRELDGFIGTDDPAAVVAGTAADAAGALKTANANYSAAKRSDLLTGVERAADLRAAAANSGKNTGNALRQRVVSALLKPKEIAGYSPEEVAALEQIVRGTRTQNVTRDIGSFFGGGGGMGQMLTAAAGAGAGGFAGGNIGAMLGAAAPVALGAGSKQISNTLTRRALQAVEEATRARSPLFETMKAKAPLEVERNTRVERIIRALLSSGVSMPQGQVTPSQRVL